MVLQFVILGFLKLAPMSGYDLKRRFDSSVNYFWAADKAQIYRTLAALVDQGLVEVRTTRGTAGPHRQEHSITAAGEEALHAWLVSDLDRQTSRDSFLARVFFAGDLDAEETAILLGRRREAAQSLLDTVTAIRESQAEPVDRAARLRLATVDNGVRHARAELEWLDDVEKALS
ncbi:MULTISPECIES: PadR family transcriptional regulator [unclassified Knoellia]|uniref:PadR family transcriptional regulator n=1 Tax=Knoellia altitudinis TaxID=3404795 RepID=UPI0036170997